MTDGVDIGTTVSSRLTGAVMQKGEAMDDIITRQAVLNTVEKLYKACEGNASDYHDLLVATFIDLPQPTIYGYDIDCLRFIAVLMRENGITPEEALSRFADYTRMAEWIRSQVLSEIGREIKEQCGIG